METALRALVRQRANETCEYCRLPQQSSPYVRFHIEHIVAQQHGGLSREENLALACGYCNHHKGPNLASLDPITSALVPLYHPRHDEWTDHFTWDGTLIVGKTPVGRATAELLGMNHWQRIELRENLQSLGETFAG